MADFGAFTRICHSQICTFLSSCLSWHSTTVLPFLVLLICLAVPTLSESVLCILGGFCNPNLISGFTLVIISICLLLLVWVCEGEGNGGGGTIVSSWLRQDGELLAFLFFISFPSHFIPRVVVSIFSVNCGSIVTTTQRLKKLVCIKLTIYVHFD